MFPANSEIFCIDKDPLNNQFKLFLSCKCQSYQIGTGTHAIVIIHIDARDLIKPILNTKIKNGITGETFLVNEEGKLLTELKYPLKNNSTGKTLESEITPPFVMNAAMGQEGITITKDYRGVPILAAYRHLRITPDSGWRLIVKKDQTEICAGMHKDRITFLMTGISGISLAFIFISFIANNLSKPILHLNLVAKKIKEGDWKIRANTLYTGEAGLLANTFNSMIDHIQLHRESLEKQVILRTKELQETNDILIKEIEDRKNSEDKLKKYGMLFDNISDLAYICDANGNILFLNKAFEKMTGHKPETFFGKPFYPLFDEENLKIAMELYTGTLHGKNLQKEVAFKDTGIICEYKNMPLFDTTGKIIGVIGVGRDITTRKTTEREKKYMGDQVTPCIEIGATNSKSEIICHVKDNGGGIDPRYHEKIFNIFERYDEKSTGSGIGLANVKKIIETHGGRIWVESEGKGKGSTFYFTIPNNEINETTITPERIYHS